MDFNMLFVLLSPFWAAMAYINVKVMVEVNREWSSNEQAIKKLQSA